MCHLAVRKFNIWKHEALHPQLLKVVSKMYGKYIIQIHNSYSTVARDLSLKKILRLRAQPEGEWLFSTINLMATVL